MEGVDEERNGGDDEDNRRGLDEGEKRGMTTGRGVRRRWIQGQLPHPGRGKLRGGLERQVGQGERGRSGDT